MSISLWIFGCLLPLPFIVEVNFFSVNVGQSPSKAVQNGGTGTQIPLGRDFWRHCIIVLKRKATIVTNVREHSMNGHLLDQRGMDVDILEADCYLPELIELLISQLNIWLLPEHFKLIAAVWEMRWSPYSQIHQQGWRCQGVWTFPPACKLPPNENETQ